MGIETQQYMDATPIYVLRTSLVSIRIEIFVVGCRKAFVVATSE